jgi:hypothetical protein
MLELGEAQCFRQDSKGILWFKGHLVVPKNFELHCKIMDKAHCSRYSIHPRTNKMNKCLSLWHNFGNNYMTVWAPISSEVQPIIPRRMGKLNESIKSSRICSVVVL